MQGMWHGEQDMAGGGVRSQPPPSPAAAHPVAANHAMAQMTGHLLPLPPLLLPLLQSATLPSPLTLPGSCLPAMKGWLPGCSLPGQGAADPAAATWIGGPLGGPGSRMETASPLHTLQQRQGAGGGQRPTASMPGCNSWLGGSCCEHSPGKPRSATCGHRCPRRQCTVLQPVARRGLTKQAEGVSRSPRRSR